MSKNLQLHIPVPCHENWNDMYAAEKGRYCLSCQKMVVDFTTMTDQQVLSYFKNAKGNTCGRFSDDQLNRNYEIDSKKRLNWFKYFLQILLPTLLVASKSYSQGEIKTKAQICASSMRMGDTIPHIKGEVTFPDSKRSINGRVVDESGLPLPDASIIIKGTQIGVVSDRDGKFSLRISKEGPVTLVASYVGYEAAELRFDTRKALSPVNIVLNQLVMGEVVVTGYGNGRRRDLTGLTYVVIKQETIFHDFTRSVVDTLQLAVGRSSVKMYPNPISLSSFLTVEYSARKDGDYKIEIFDVSGRLIQVEKFNVISSRFQKQIRLNQAMVAGTYLISFSGPNGKRFASQKLIVE